MNPPALPGNYAITATFAGTEGYYGFAAEAHVYVGSATDNSSAYRYTRNGIATMSALTMESLLQ